MTLFLVAKPKCCLLSIFSPSHFYKCFKEYCRGSQCKFREILFGSIYEKWRKIWFANLPIL